MLWDGLGKVSVILHGVHRLSLFFLSFYVIWHHTQLLHLLPHVSVSAGEDTIYICLSFYFKFHLWPISPNSSIAHLKQFICAGET